MRLQNFVESEYDRLLKIKGLDKKKEVGILYNQIKLKDKYKSEDWHKYKRIFGKVGNEDKL